MSTEELRRRLLATMPPSMDRKRVVIDEQIRQAHERIRVPEEQIAVNEQKLAALQRGAARLTRRDQISQATGALGWQCGDLTAWRQQVERLEAERVDLDQADRQREQWAQEHAGDLTAYADGIRHAEAAARRQATLREVTTAPEARPDDPTNRSRWRRELIDPSRNRSRDHEYSLDLDLGLDIDIA